MGEHEWVRDPGRRGEGLICRNCQITEAEAEGSPGDVTLCPRTQYGDLTL